VSYLGNDYVPPRKDTYYQGLVFSVRDRLIESWLKTQRSFYWTIAELKTQKKGLQYICCNPLIVF